MNELPRCVRYCVGLTSNCLYFSTDFTTTKINLNKYEKCICLRYFKSISLIFYIIKISYDNYSRKWLQCWYQRCSSITRLSRKTALGKEHEKDSEHNNHKNWASNLKKEFHKQCSPLQNHDNNNYHSPPRHLSKKKSFLKTELKSNLNSKLFLDQMKHQRKEFFRMKKRNSRAKIYISETY